MLKVGEVIGDAASAGLPTGLYFIIRLSDLGVFIQAASGSGVGPVSGPVGDSLIVQAEIIRIRLKPGEMPALQIGAPKEEVVVLLIESHVIPHDRLCRKRPDSPRLVLCDLPMKPIEGIRGVSEIVSRNQPPPSKIHGHAAEVNIRAKSSSKEVMHR